jgi:hypothetical protein
MRAKNQTSRQQEQAFDAVAIFYEITPMNSSEDFASSKNNFMVSEKRKN